MGYPQNLHHSQMALNWAYTHTPLTKHRKYGGKTVKPNKPSQQYHHRWVVFTHIPSHVCWCSALPEIDCMVKPLASYRSVASIWKWSGFAGGEKGTWEWKKGSMDPQFMVQLMKHDDSAVDAMSFFQYFQTNIMRDISNISTKTCHSFQKTPFFSPENPIFSVRFLASVLPKIAKSRKVPQLFATLTPGDGNGGNGGIFLAKLWPKQMAKKTWPKWTKMLRQWMLHGFFPGISFEDQKKTMANKPSKMDVLYQWKRRFWPKKWMGQICFPKNFQLPKFRT